MLSAFSDLKLNILFGIQILLFPNIGVNFNTLMSRGSLKFFFFYQINTL